MKRAIFYGAAVGGVLVLITLAACTQQPGPNLGTLYVDVNPDAAHVTVLAGQSVVDTGYGDVELAYLEPGTYAVAATLGSSTYSGSVEIRARERATARIELGDPPSMHLSYEQGSVAPLGNATRERVAPQQYGPPSGRGGGSGGGGGGPGGGSGEGGGSGGLHGSAGGSKGDLYGDLWVIARNTDGSPVTEEVTSLDGTATLDCVIPLAADGTEIHLVVATDGPEPKCELAEADLDRVQEVDFGRLDLVRSPDHVIAKAYDEAMATLTASDDGELKTDPAGRLVAVIDGVDQLIDSPLENLALYQHLMSDLDAGVAPLGGLALPDPPSASVTSWSWLDVAAGLFAAGADKTGTISIDEVVYMNGFLGLNDDGYGHYTAYGYSRSARYNGVETELLVESPVGSGQYVTETVPVLGTVTFTGSNNGTGSNVAGFAKATDDALQVIEYIHAYSVPVAP